MTAALTTEQQAAKTKAEAEAFAARRKQTAAAQKNPFSPSAAKLAAQAKAKAAEPVLSVTITTPAGQTVQTPTDPVTAAEMVRQTLAALVDETRQKNLAGARQVTALRIEMDARVN